MALWHMPGIHHHGGAEGIEQGGGLGMKRGWRCEVNVTVSNQKEREGERFQPRSTVGFMMLIDG